MDDLSVQVPLSCPTCGCTEFSEVSGQDQDSADERRFICAHCGVAISRDQLTEASSASIDATIQDMGDDIISALSKDLKKALKRKGWKVK